MILVTGATGFLGAQLARQLTAPGENIICLKREQSNLPLLPDELLNRITWYDADMLDFAALEDVFKTGITQVYHCAAIVSFNPALKEQMLKTNAEGTANMVTLCIQYGARMLHVSSIAALGEAKPGELITEECFFEDAVNPGSYALSKYESEMEVWRGIAEGLNAVIVNPSVIIGASSGTSGSGQIFAKIQKGFKFFTTGSCGFVDVDDVAKCMIVLMKSDIAAQRFIINAENYSYKQLFKETAEACGVAVPNIALKPWLLSMAWRVSVTLSFITQKRIGIDRVSASSASKHLCYDNSKIKKAISFQFKPLNSTITEICQMLKEQDAK